jgi:DNA-binding NtrC family response regulator
MTGSKGRLLVVDDEYLQRWALKQRLNQWDYEVIEAGDSPAALEVLSTELPDLVLLDLRLGETSGLDLLRRFKAIDPSVVVIMITAHGALDDAVSAFRLGLFDFMSKPVDFDALRSMIRHALEARSLRTEVRRLRDRDRTVPGGIVGESGELLAALRTMRKVAESGATTILLQGESGTGKDLFAKAIHDSSPRADGRFVAVNCAALPDMLLESELFGHEKGAFTDARAVKKGLFETANGGTLYLDEISELKLGLQAKLLRVIETLTFRRVGSVRDASADVRIVAASNRRLYDAVDRGEFRPDLFYRLGVIQLDLPALRDRRSDIPLLIDHFIREYNLKLRKSIRGVTPDALKALANYRWPGNVRELKNAIERAMILEEGDQIGLSYLALPDVTAGAANVTSNVVVPGNGLSLDAVEETLVRNAMIRAGGNQSKAARMLDVGRDALRYKLKKFGITQSGSQPGSEGLES